MIRGLLVFVLGAFLHFPAVPRADAQLKVDTKVDRLILSHAGRPLADFVFVDPKIRRPYFANVHGPKGTRITRNHPPIPGKDATDHDTMHPGIWLGFGDINGIDFWRNKGFIKHVRFASPPEAMKDKIMFTSEGQLQSPDGKPVGSLVNRCTWLARPAGWLLIWDATFRADATDLVFGDQEEMGFGARVATKFTEKNQGVILNSHGNKTAKHTWGQPASWCDYSGMRDEQAVGIMLMASPRNFRESWWHNRDYGVFVANPFGRAAMRQGAKSAVTIHKGESLGIVFGAMLHEGQGFNPEAEYRHFASAI